MNIGPVWQYAPFKVSSLRLSRSESQESGRSLSDLGYHARMARRAQHLRCYVREANERTTSWIRFGFLFAGLRGSSLRFPPKQQSLRYPGKFL